MKKLSLFLIGALLFSFATLAQQATTVERKIEIEEGDNPKVTITTTEDGKTTITELEGAAAEEFIEEREAKNSTKRKGHRSIVEIEIDEEEADEIKEQVRAVTIELSDEMDRIGEEIKRINMDSIMESVGVEIERSLEGVKYHFDSDDGESKSVIIIRSNNDEDEEIDVEVEVRKHGDKEEREVHVTRTKMVVEDDDGNDKSEPSLKDLNVYPVPTEGNLNVDFENQGDGPVKIRVLDMQGKTVREMKIKGAGKKHMKMNLDDLPAGTYSIEVEDRDGRATKRLVLE